MTAGGDDDSVGYKRPPKATRWRKGQSGNPKGGRPRRRLDLAGFIDRKLAEPIDIIENGERSRISVLAAIMRRLFAEEMRGSKKAAAVRMKYQELVPPSVEPPEIVVRHALPDD